MDFSSRDIGGLEDYYDENEDNLDNLRVLRGVLERRKQTGRVWRKRHESLLVKTVNRINVLESDDEEVDDDDGEYEDDEFEDDESEFGDGDEEEEEDDLSNATEVFLEMDHSARVLEWHQTMLNTQRRLGLATSPPNQVSTQGSGPYSEISFDQFLESEGIQASAISQDFEILVVGSDNYSEDEIDWLIEERGGKSLKVYSQEMMAAWLSSGRDPFGNEEIMREFLDGHPALEWLNELDDYDWFAGVSLASPNATSVFLSMVHSQDALDWHEEMLADDEGLFDFPDVVGSIGSDPYPEGEFDAFLENQGVTPVGEDNEYDVLVVGRDGWSEEQLAAIIWDHRGQTLRIYSQEMMAAWLSCGVDPFETPSILDAFRQGHPALEWLGALKQYHWPQGVLASSSGMSQRDMIRDETGLLSEIDYHVGKTWGLSDSQRRARLGGFMAGTIWRDWGKGNDILRYGPPMTCGRLRDLARAIAHQIYEKRNHSGGDYSVAVAEWQSDLDWLKMAYYKPLGCGFIWEDGR